MYRKRPTVRIAPRRSNQRNEAQDVSLHNTAFFDKRRKDEMSGFCKAIASKAAAFQALDSITEEGIRSNDSFLCISNDSTAD